MDLRRSGCDLEGEGLETSLGAGNGTEVVTESHVATSKALSSGSHSGKMETCRE